MTDSSRDVKLLATGMLEAIDCLRALEASGAAAGGSSPFADILSTAGNA